ncbi:DUF4142 domain-containing protein [Spirosoma soli]
MKGIIFSLTLVAGILLLAGCSSEPDSNGLAEEINNQRIENASENTPEAKAATSKNDQKDVAEYMVDLADISLAKHVMSLLAIKRSVHPAVQVYAHETVQQEDEERQRLNAQGQQYKITLPSTLSNTSQLMVAKLEEQKTGADFDSYYLSYIAELNDSAISKAQNLIKNTDKPALAGFFENLIATDELHMKKATDLKKSIN